MATFIPTAQYLRMSTEHQQYSLQNQSAAIQKYAESHGFEIVRTYSDAAKSGLVLKHRTGLRQLLQDVVAGTPAYRAILVYDVSRWGRFQDIDESAHYEFLCKSAGVPIHYCAESFANDGTVTSSIMKAFKRAMAGEYSRELGIKVFAGQKRLAELGFKQGGSPGYGFRRMLVSAAKEPKQPLTRGERKSIAQDRVVLMHGPAEEIECVREIFRMFTVEKLSLRGIAKELNRMGVPFLNHARWSHHVVARMLSHPKYKGCNVFNRTSMRLGSRRVYPPQTEWIVAPHSHEPIIDEPTFAKAQQILGSLTNRKSNQQFLESLRALLVSKGSLSAEIITDAPEIVTLNTLRRRFGSLRAAYELIGYHKPGNWDAARTFLALREDLLSRIQEMFPDEVSVMRGRSRWRSFLKLRNGIMVSVLIAHLSQGWKKTKYWQIKPVLGERRFVTMLARLDAQRQAFLDFHILPRMDQRKTFYVPYETQTLCKGVRLTDLSSFCDTVKAAHSSRKTTGWSGGRAR